MSTDHRIPEIDGLRAVAVLGVMFAHVWAFGCGNIALYLGPIDLNRALSVFGTGVDLFFVISGFCMYLAYDAKSPGFTWSGYRRFIVGRIFRIVPAYVVAVMFAAAIWTGLHGEFPIGLVAAHFLFLHTLIPDGNVLAAPFWSLAAEWHFYLVLPLLVAAARRWGYGVTLTAVVLASIVYRGIETTWAPTSDFQMPSRLSEFALGIAVGRAHLTGGATPSLVRGTAGVLTGACLMLFGRVLMTDQIAGSPIWVPARAINVSMLAGGYALVLWSVIGTRSWAAAALRSPVPRWIGRVSYSFYLWHWFPAIWIGSAMMAMSRSQGWNSGWVPLLATAIAAGLVSLVAWLSYVLLEAPYFARGGLGPRMIRSATAPTSSIAPPVSPGLGGGRQ